MSRLQRSSSALALQSRDGDDGGLKQWLVNQNFYMPRTADARGATHLLMTGGKLCIADDQYDNFLQYYAADLERKSATLWWSLHENATRYSRVYFDFDIAEWSEREGAEMSKAEILKFVRILQLQVLAHFPDVAQRRRGVENKLDHRGLCVVLGAPTAYAQKYNEKSNTMQWRRKTGLHIIFPYLYADLNQLLQLRTATIDALDRHSDKFDPPDGATSWAAVIDEAVYTNNAGLRMPGSDKFDVCDACKRKRSAMCNVCNGRERVRIERAYWPMMSLDATGASTKQWEVLRADPHRMLRLCTIRMPRQYVNDPSFSIPAKAAIYADQPIIYTVDTQYILDHLPVDYLKNKKTRAIGGGVGNDSNSTSLTISTPLSPNSKEMPIDMSRNNPGTSWHLAERQGRGYKRASTTAAINPITGAKRGVAMSASARSDFAASRELQTFEQNHYFCQLFERFLRSQTHKWPQYERICVLSVKRSVPQSFRGRVPRGGSNADAETHDELLRQKQSIAAMTMIDDPHPCIFLIAVRGQGSRYCQNVGREHSTSKIYFYANDDGIAQRCFCKKRSIPALAAASGNNSIVVRGAAANSERTNSNDDDDAIPSFVGEDKPFCSAYSSMPINWTDHALGLLILDTLFGYRKHGAIDRPTYGGTLPTIVRPQDSSYASPFPSLINQMITAKNDASDAMTSSSRIDEQDALAKRLVDERIESDIQAMLSVPVSATPGENPIQLQQHHNDYSGGISAEDLRRIVTENDLAGTYIPPLSTASMETSRNEVFFPSMPLPTSHAQAHEQALAVMTRNMRGQRERIERFTGGLSRRDDIASELRARLAPSNLDTPSSSVTIPPQ